MKNSFQAKYKLKGKNENRIVSIVEQKALITGDEHKDFSGFKETYDRFVFKQTGIDSKIRSWINNQQAKAYNSKQSLFSKIVSILYTPSPINLDGTSILDVGCSTGIFLNSLPNYWKREGLEINRAASKIAIESGLTIHEETFENCKTKSKYDIIRCSHVIEHVKEEKKFMKKAVELLNKGGKLIIYTPNLNSLTRIIFQRNWEGFYDETHFIIYSLDSIAKLGEQYKLKTIKRSTYYMGYTYPSLIRHLNVTSKVLKSFVLIFCIIILPLEILISKFKLGLGDALFIEFSKE